VSLSEAKAHCRVDASTDDAYITSLIQVAREYVEERLDLTLITTVWQARYDVFPIWEMLLPRPPMQQQNVTVTYRNESGALLTITSAGSAFQVDHLTTPGRIYPLYNGVWPAVRGDENSVMVQWTAGYGGTGSAVPATVRHAILLLVAHWYGTREPVTTGTTAQNLPIPLTFETLMAASGWGGYR
jgi:uncharacterized phiE125 gp8 family phage protein